MIQWDLTKEKFGVTKETISNRKKVIVRCISCQESKERLYKSYTKTLNNNDGKYYCKKCKFKTNKFKEKISAIIKDRWTSQEYRTKLRNNKEYKKKLSQNTKKLWEEGKYDNCFDDSFIEKMTTINNHNLSQPETKEKLSKSSKKLWQNKEYRETQINRLNSEETKKNLSEKTRETWLNPNYRKKVLDKLNSSKCKEQRSRISKNLWKNKEYRDNLLKIFQSDEYKTNHAIGRSKSPRITKPMRMLYSILDSLDVGYHKEGINTKIGYYVFDCLIPSNNLLIEVHGDYWHNINSKDESIKNNVTNDKRKYTYIHRYFPEYKIIYFWEREFYTNKVIDRLKYELNINHEKIDFDFSTVEIRKIRCKDSREFLETYHYLGPNRGGIIYGAYLENKLIATCMFSKPTRNQTTSRLNLEKQELIELSRFCIHPKYQKKNFASWFISRCIKSLDNHIKCVISFADTTKGHNGTIYKASNFVDDGIIPPDYWYVDNDGYVMHKQTLYKRAIKMSLTEKEFATKYNYTKKYGGEKYRYLYWR